MFEMITLIVLAVLAFPIIAIVALVKASSLGSAVTGLESRINALERAMERAIASRGGQAPQAVPAPTVAAQTPPRETSAVTTPPVLPAQPPPPVAAPSPRPVSVPAVAATAHAQAPAAPAAIGFEEKFGTRWVVWVGGVALALGGIFLVRYTIEQGLIGPGVRIALGALHHGGLRHGLCRLRAL
jgi:uncharacterized membrane protein